MKNLKTILVVLLPLLFSLQKSAAQTKTLLSVSDFDKQFGTTFIFSGTDNKWIVNNQYSGSGKFPNTPSQTSTLANIGVIGNADGNYLHIYSSSATPANANFDPSKNSDSWAVMDKVCTLGYSDITLTFFWTGGGSDNAYGEVYYSIDGGEWKLCTSIDGITQYNYNHSWKYTVINSPDFVNHLELQFAFRWYNAAIATEDTLSFGIDDVFVVATTAANPSVVLTAENVAPPTGFPPLCQNDPRGTQFFFSSSDSLCANGIYEIEISDANGNFNNPVILPFTLTTGNPLVPNVTYNSPVPPDLNYYFPTTLPPGTCYKWRIRLLTPPYSTSVESPCFPIGDCMDSITTLQPCVTKDNPPEQLCICSAIDVPFYSYGAFNPANLYVAELSDSSGSFDNPTVINTKADIETWNNSLSSELFGFMPKGNGLISGIVPTVPPGCNYYVRVNSTDPDVKGKPWGPFCITKCDIKTNGCQDINVCLGELSGDTIAIPVDIHTWDSATSYGAGNEFKVQILGNKNPNAPPCMDLLKEDAVGDSSFATLMDTTSGLLRLKFPPLPKWKAWGLKADPSNYYLRVVATNPSDTADAKGTIIRLTVSGWKGIPLDIQCTNNLEGPDTICAARDNINILLQMDTCPTIYSVDTGNRLELRWVGKKEPPGIKDIYFDGINYPGDSSASNKWTTTIDTFINSEDTGWHNIKVLSSYCNYYNGTLQGFQKASCYVLDFMKVDTVWLDSLHTIIDSLKYIPVSSIRVNNPIPAIPPLPFGISSSGTYAVTIVELCNCDPSNTGPVSDKIFFTLQGPPNVKISGDSVVCIGDTITYSCPFEPATYYEWTWPSGMADTLVISNNEITLVWKNKGSGNLNLLGLGLCGEDQSSQIVSVTDEPVTASVSLNSIICEGDTVQLIAKNLNPDVGGLSFNKYAWTSDKDTAILGNDTLIKVAPDTTTAYNVKITFFGCEDEATTVVNVNPNAEALSGNYEMCEKDSVQLDGGKGTDFIWAPATGLSNVFIINPVATPDTTIQYTVIASYKNGCKDDTAKINIQVNLLTPCVAGPDITIVKGQSTTLNGCLGDSVIWSPGLGLNDSTLINPIASPDNTTTYIIKSIDINGCVQSDEITVRVVEGPKIIVPNAFSPNGDGENDVFFPISVAVEKLLEFKIFNRWGEVVFETTDIRQGWDGTYRGAKQEIGTYVYYIKAETINNEVQTLQGSVTLIR